MKYSNKFLGIVMTLMAGGVLVSCTNELTEPTGSNAPSNAINLVKAPEIIAYSGSLKGTNVKGVPQLYANSGDGYINNPSWDVPGVENLENITDAERQAVLDAIKAKVTGNRISEDVVFPWTSYFLQDVISGQNGSWPGAGSDGNPSNSYAFEAYNKGAKCNQQYWPGTDYEDYEEITNSGHINSYYQRQENDGSQTRIGETALMTDMAVGTYEEMKGKQFRWYVNCHENLHWYEYIVVNVNGSYYICFDFACGHKENDVDGNPGKGSTQNDWDYNDWILKISPAGIQPEVIGENPEENPDPEPPVAPEDPEGDDVVSIPDHVEVNLSLEERLSYLTSHLSIHVRAVTDVEVFIPIPASYVCEADDLDIVQKHQEDLMVHGGPATLDFNVNGEIVTLTVATEAEGIRVTTSGINDNVIAYLKEQNNDGITFEVWNYFNIKHSDWINITHEYLNLDELKDMMNQSTVKFLTKAPDLYVNAFMYETGDAEYHEGHEGIFCDDFTVKPYDSSLYGVQETNWFYNNSPYNELYYNPPTAE